MNGMLLIREFIYRYYIYPIDTKQGYNLIQEITYGILLFVMVYTFYKICLKLKIAIDRRFAEVTVFYVILITLMRALVDAGLFPRLYYTVTPGIVVAVGIYYMISIIISGILLKKRYYLLSIAMAVVPILYMLFEFSSRITHPEAIVYVSGILVLSYYLLIYIVEKLKKAKIERIDKYAIFSQLVDASATSVGIGVFGYWEQHPVPRFFMDYFGPYSIIPLKMLVVLLVLDIFNKEVKDDNLRNILKITVMALGLAPGLRNLFRTVMGV